MLGIFLDTETNGLNILRHRVLEIAFKIVDILTGEEIDAYHAVRALSLFRLGKERPRKLAHQWIYLARDRRARHSY